MRDWYCRTMPANAWVDPRRLCSRSSSGSSTFISLSISSAVELHHRADDHSELSKIHEGGEAPLQVCWGAGAALIWGATSKSLSSGSGLPLVSGPSQVPMKPRM